MSRNRFFTADHHFGHTNILKHESENRRNKHGSRFSSIDQMDDYLVDQWNATVKAGDVVYYLGDFSMKLQNTLDILPFLNGEKTLIAGNHDSFFKQLVGTDQHKKREARESALQAGFSEVHLRLEIDLPGVGLVLLSHFPYAPPENERADLSAYELRYLEHRPVRGKEKLLLHGHVHSEWLAHQYNNMPPMLNVGVDMWGMRPASEAEIVENFRGL